jgi:uncharacterized heparinase superfamily protein
MPAISLVSGDNPPAEEAPAPAPRVTRGQGQSRAVLGAEAARIALRRAFEPAVTWFRAGWLYRHSFRGPVPDRILFHPSDPRTHRLEDADALMRGRFRFAGQLVEIREGSIFDQPMPSPSFAAALHGFDWLRHLEAAGGDLARQFTLKLTRQWLKRHARYTRFVWRPEIIADRLLNLLTYGRFFLANSDLVWRSRLFVSLRDQTQMLARTLDEAPDGLPRLKSAAALTLAGVCLHDSRSAAAGLKRLAIEIERQILPDGGHISRSPEALLESFRVLSLVQQALDRARREIQPALRSALDRMAPMLRFFRMGDGALALFHGGGEQDARTLEAALEQDEAAGKPLGYAPYSGFQRLAAGRVLVLLDCGLPPPGPFSTAAHAGCLAFEMSSGAHRLIVNCGMAAGETDEWRRALRSTAAHSTLTLADTPSAKVLADGMMARLLGPRLVDGPGIVEARRSESPQGLTVEASHDSYRERFGIIHRRSMMLSPRGLKLSGMDSLVPSDPGYQAQRSRGLTFTIRFHVHPDVRLSLAKGGGSVILKLPNGEGWRLRCGSGALGIEESIYFGGGSARRAEQLVVSGQWSGEPIECPWLLEQVGSA